MGKGDEGELMSVVLHGEVQAATGSSGRRPAIEYGPSRDLEIDGQIQEVDWAGDAGIWRGPEGQEQSQAAGSRLGSARVTRQARQLGLEGPGCSPRRLLVTLDRDGWGGRRSPELLAMEDRKWRRGSTWLQFWRHMLAEGLRLLLKADARGRSFLLETGKA